jgi:hypothetical protein
MSNYNYFYSFHNQPLARNLFTVDAEDGTPSPPASGERITENSIERITEDGQIRITE